MVDQHGNAEQQRYQVQFDTEQFFNLQRQILNGGAPPDQGAGDPAQLVRHGERGEQVPPGAPAGNPDLSFVSHISSSVARR